MNVLFILILNLKESVDKQHGSNHLNGDRYILKLANEAIQLYRASDRGADLYVVEW